MPKADIVYSTHSVPIPLRTEPLGSPGSAVFVPTGATPDEIFCAIGRLRCEAEEAIEGLLIFLDATEADPNLEPSLGWTTGGAEGATDDREVDGPVFADRRPVRTIRPAQGGHHHGK